MLRFRVFSQLYLYDFLRIPACKLMNQHLATLAREFKATKFLKIVADQCIPNYPDRNVPTLLVYGEGDIKANIVGAIAFGGMNMTVSSKFSLQEAMRRERSHPDTYSNPF